MGDLEHVAYCYRRDVEHDGEKNWHIAPKDAPEIDALRERGWQVERLYRKEGDDG